MIVLSLRSVQDFERNLDSQAKVLQNELSKVAYSIGQRDHELKALAGL